MQTDDVKKWGVRWRACTLDLCENKDVYSLPCCYRRASHQCCIFPLLCCSRLILLLSHSFRCLKSDEKFVRVLLSCVVCIVMRIEAEWWYVRRVGFRIEDGWNLKVRVHVTSRVTDGGLRTMKCRNFCLNLGAKVASILYTHLLYIVVVSRKVTANQISTSKSSISFNYYSTFISIYLKYFHPFIAKICKK